MKLFGRKKAAEQAAVAHKDEKPKSPYKEGNEFIQAAADFEKSEIDNVKKREKIAWTVTGAAALVAVAAVFTVAAMQPLVRVEPYILLVDSNTGKTNVITTLEHQTVDNDKVLNKHWLGRYVVNREGYDWYTIQDTYDTTIAMSSPQEQARYSKPYQDGVGPDKILKEDFRVKVEIKSISFVGETAQVRFSKTKLPVNPSSGVQPITEHQIATIAYHYDNPPTKEEERDYNPVGFIVDSYQVEVENVQS